VQVRKRLLFGSLAVSVVISVALGWALAQDDTGQPDTVVIPGDDASASTFELPSIETNDDVEGDRLPSVEVSTLDGDRVDTSSLTGGPLVINVWGSTCSPCVKELPAFAEVHQRYGDEVRFVGISFLGPSEREEEFARDLGVQYELRYDGDGEFVTALGIATFPVTLFIDADGTIVRQTGQLDETELTRYVEELR